MDTKVAVLGSNGFIGSYICKWLTKNSNFKIIPVTRTTLNLLNFNEVSKWLKTNKIDTIINCAIIGGKQNLGEINYQNLQDNLLMFLNFYNNSDNFNKFINIGSGAEFGLQNDIDSVKEQDILNSIPNESYGLSKNIISRLSLEKNNFYTLRLFGCFNFSEPDFRLFKKLINLESIDIIDKKFDFISAEDLCKIVYFYIINDNLKYKDINCVYSNKLLLSEITKIFVEYHKLNCKINIKSNSSLNYCGDSSKIDSLIQDLNGLNEGIINYFNNR